MKTAVERRRFRRAELDVPVTIRQADNHSTHDSEPIIGQVKDVSLAGVFCYVKAPCALQVGEQVVCSVAIPQEQARWFPFNRILGKGWVARLKPIPMGRRGGDRLGTEPEEEILGLAVAFHPDVSALGTIGY